MRERESLLDLSKKNENLEPFPNWPSIRSVEGGHSIENFSVDCKFKANFNFLVVNVAAAVPLMLLHSSCRFMAQSGWLPLLERLYCCCCLFELPLLNNVKYLIERQWQKQ